MELINSTRLRIALAGAVSAAVGAVIAEVLIGVPRTTTATVLFGCLVGLCLGAALTVIPALGIQSTKRIQRAALIGAGTGLLGGAIGAAFGQAAYTVTSGSGAGSAASSVFSTDMQARLEEAGAKTGEIEVGLIWENSNDLDLHVFDPTGEEIFFAHKVARSGGELDVDRNAGCTRNITNKPVEHVVWPTGRAPSGDYRIYVHHFDNCGNKDPTDFRIELVGGGKTHDVLRQHVFRRGAGVRTLVRLATGPFDDG